MTSLDLTTTPGEATAGLTLRMRRSMCVVLLENRPDCCGRDDAHGADVFLRLGCGCTFTYCRHALIVIYGRTKITYAVCPRHERQAIFTADWL